MALNFLLGKLKITKLFAKILYMTTYTVTIKIMPLKDLLDPQGKAVLGGLHNLGLHAIQDVRIGKNISVQINAASEEAAKEMATQAAKQLLANLVMEDFEVVVQP